MIKKKTLYLILLSFILINIGQMEILNNIPSITTLLTVHGGGGL